MSSGRGAAVPTWHHADFVTRGLSLSVPARGRVHGAPNETRHTRGSLDLERDVENRLMVTRVARDHVRPAKSFHPP